MLLHTSDRELKNLLPFNLRKNIVQALVLSKSYYNDVIYHTFSDYLQKRLQRVQKAAASFVVVLSVLLLHNISARAAAPSLPQ